MLVVNVDAHRDFDDAVHNSNMFITTMPILRAVVISIRRHDDDGMDATILGDNNKELLRADAWTIATQSLYGAIIDGDK